MLRKHNKLIMLLVLVTFMFTIVGSAGAASFSDVTGTSAQTAAIYKLNSLGIIDGYQDGTFGPDKNITRAEFAKIACITAGLKSVASGMGSTASPFSDVATNHWANGWINVAAAQGYVKGDPAGTFRPEAQITQAEAITVLMRILGYNDNLPGNWPSDYIAKAANLGDLDDVTFVADQPATRGIIAILTAAVLDEVTVDYAASDNLFKENSDGATLLAKNFTSVATDTDTPSLVYDLDLSGGDQAIKILDPALDPTDSTDAATIAKDLASGTFKSLKLTDDCVISGADSITGVVGRYVDFITNDDGDVTYIKVRNDDDYKIITGVDPKDVDYVDANTIKINDKKYDISNIFGTYSSNPRGFALTTNSGTTLAPAGFTAGVPTKLHWPAGAGFLGDDNTLCGATYPLALGVAEKLGYDEDSTPTDAQVATALAGKDGIPSAHIPGMGLYWGNYNGLSLDKYLLQLGIQMESVDFVLNKDGDVAFINGNAWPTNTVAALDEFKAVGVVDSVATSSAKIKFKNTTAKTIDLDEDDATSYVIVKNGKIATLADVAENDMIWDLDKYSTELIVDMSMTKEGSLDSYSDKTFYSPVNMDLATKVTIAGTQYNVIKGGGLLSTDDSDSFAPITEETTINSDFDDILGDDVTAWFSPTGSIAAVASTTAGTSGKIYGVINDDTVNTLVNGKLTNAIEVLKADGTFATYAPDTDSEVYATGWDTDNDEETAKDWVKMNSDPEDYIGTKTDIHANNVLTNDTLVEISLNSDGYIDRIKTQNDFATPYDEVSGDKDNDVVTFDTGDYDAKGMVIFNLQRNSDDDLQIASYSDFMDKVDDNPIDATGCYYEKDGTAKYAVIDSDELSSSTDKVAMVDSTGKDSTDPFVYLMTTGASVKYYVKDDASGWKDNTVVVYTMSGDKVELSDSSDITKVESAQEIDKISGKIITIGDNSYYVDSDTLYFDNTKDNPAVCDFSDLAAGDTVNIYSDNDGAIEAVEIVD